MSKYAEILDRAQIRKIETTQDLRKEFDLILDQHENWVTAAHVVFVNALVHVAEHGDTTQIYRAANLKPNSVWIPRMSEWLKAHSNDEMSLRKMKNDDGSEGWKVFLAKTRNPDNWDIRGACVVTFNEFKPKRKAKTSKSLEERMVALARSAFKDEVTSAQFLTIAKAAFIKAESEANDK